MYKPPKIDERRCQIEVAAEHGYLGSYEAHAVTLEATTVYADQRQAHLATALAEHSGRKDLPRLRSNLNLKRRKKRSLSAEFDTLVFEDPLEAEVIRSKPTAPP